LLAGACSVGGQTHAALEFCAADEKSSRDSIPSESDRSSRSARDAPAIRALRQLRKPFTANLAKNPAGLAASRRRIGRAVQRRCADRRPVGIR
jgi:hypothetical protein